MTAHFVADLHLHRQRPGLVRLFHDYLAGPAREARALYILGDLFEYWIGDDGSLPDHRDTVAALRALTDAGVALYFMHGNRDFAIGADFARATGATLLQDPHPLALYGHRAVLTHGDLLCTEDHAHQRFRARYTDPAWLARMLTLPVWWRRVLAWYGRSRSRFNGRRNTREIMDVSPAAVARFLQEQQADLLIHGHTHRPADHALAGGAHRLVLADWHEHAGEVLIVDATGWRRERLEA